MSISEVRIKSVPENERYCWISIGGRHFGRQTSWGHLSGFSLRDDGIQILIDVYKFKKLIEKWEKNNYLPAVKIVRKSIFQANDTGLSPKDVRCELNFNQKGEHKVIVEVKQKSDKKAEFSLEEVKLSLNLMALCMD